MHCYRRRVADPVELAVIVEPDPPGSGMQSKPNPRFLARFPAGIFQNISGYFGIKEKNS